MVAPTFKRNHNDQVSNFLSNGSSNKNKNDNGFF